MREWWLHLSKASAAAMPEKPPTSVTVSETYVTRRARLTRLLLTFPERYTDSVALMDRSWHQAWVSACD